MEYGCIKKTLPTKIKTKKDGVGDKIKMIIHQSEVVIRDFFGRQRTT
ncbi:hypothetical protein O163_10345 [Caldanaerobacter subterraneus subsp. yonseiensis KB-1]|uniref:Uncharacterized protein n=1 Tax=Caldanaerobacter subterraneus subsp. yonseiensis KB-1 TaxID=1388761 RepID=U5CN85_CALSX|nr:hypothetical protein O163_10345 [Caldanaerobacter subterraneus subsp. yonseiensis KB-1]